MAMSMNDFLKRYFRQLNFDKMSDAQKRQFDSYVAKDDFRGDMKSWRDDLLKKDASGNPFKGPDGHYVHNDLPDGLNGDTQMEEKDWADLYTALYNAFVAMNNAKGDFAEDKDKDRDGAATIKFLNEYFGDGKVFSPSKLDNNVKEKINGLLTVIRDSSAQADGDDLYTLLRLNHAEIKQLKNLVDKPNDFDKPENREFIDKLVQNLFYEIQYGDNIKEDSPLLKIDLQSIRNALYQEKEPTHDDLSRLQSRYKDILNDLYSKPKVFNIFKEYDKSKISKALNSALENTDYNGKTKEANFVKPKYDSTLDWKEKLQKNTKEFYDDKLKKYVTAHRDHIYVLDTAKTIGGVLTDLKVNPNDGLDKILKEKENDIIDKLRDKQPLKSIDHFQWFVKTIKDFQKQGKDKEIAGALRDGDKMNHLVEDMAIKAIEDGKIAEVKTAMEVLKVLQQPLFSGRTMDAVRKTDFTLFSDSGLSFNKANPAIQSVMNAVDKTIGFGIKGAVMAGTGLASLYNRRNLGLHKTGKLEEGHQKHEKERDLFKQKQEELNLEDDVRIIDAYQEQQKTGIKDEKDLTAKEKRLQNAKKKLEKLTKDRDAAIAEFDKYDVIIQDFNNRKGFQKNNDDSAETLKGLTEKLQGMSGNPANQMEVIDKKYGSAKDLEEKFKEITDGGPDSIYEKAKANKERLEGAVEKKETQISVLEQKISKYKAMAAEMDFYKAAINQRNEKVANWDEDNKDYYYELMGFWNFLQTGHVKNIFALGTKKLQQKMDNGQMAQIYSDWMKNQGYTK